MQEWKNRIKNLKNQDFLEKNPQKNHMPGVSFTKETNLSSSWCTYKPFSITCECHNRWCCSGTLCIFNDSWRWSFHNWDTWICCPQINTDDLPLNCPWSRKKQVSHLEYLLQIKTERRNTKFYNTSFTDYNNPFSNFCT